MFECTMSKLQIYLGLCQANSHLRTAGELTGRGDTTPQGQMWCAAPVRLSWGSQVCTSLRNQGNSQDVVVTTVSELPEVCK
jgi:hypothetical protein|eukprot:COSAG02_NODE_3880_length_6093_cov_33.940274_1_plen_81_part_00